MRLGLIIVGLLVVFKPFAQVVQVIDPLEYMPIADVVITDAKCTKAVKTNMLGEALIEAFSAKDSLIFEHPYYNTKKIAFKTIKKDANHFVFLFQDDKAGTRSRRRRRLNFNSDVELERNDVGS